MINDSILEQLSTLTKKHHDASGRFVYNWKTVNYILEKILKSTSDSEVFKMIMKILSNLGKQVENEKKDVNLPSGELEMLQNLFPNDKNKIQLNKQIKSLFNASDEEEKDFARNPSWLLRTQLDAQQLDQRATVCEEIKTKVFNALDKLTDGLKCQEKRFAPIKGMIRALVKLVEQIDKKMKQGGEIKTSVQDAKDLLRMSFVCRDAHETTAIFEALTAHNDSFSVQQIKNGFANYEKGKQCDIKIILKTKSELTGSFEELVEIQLIQSLFIDWKRIEHLIQDQTRALQEYQNHLASNQHNAHLMKTLFNSSNLEDPKNAAIEIIKTNYQDLGEVKEIADIYIDIEKFCEKKSMDGIMSVLKDNQKLKNYIFETQPEKTILPKIKDMQKDTLKQQMKEDKELAKCVCRVIPDFYTLLKVQHGGSVNNATQSPDGKQIASCSGDETVKVTEVSTGNLVCTISHGQYVLNATWSPDGNQIASCSVDKTVKVTEVTYFIIDESSVRIARQSQNLI